MSNIRIDLEATVINGQTLTFKSPVDCSQITGLILYYPEGDTTKSTVFQFADAHGNNVGDINLFAENVLVKVILDTDLKRAYVQNADTNAYIEDTFLKKAGGTMSGAINMGSKKITNVGTPTNDTDAANKKFVEDAIADAVFEGKDIDLSGYLQKSGGTMTGVLAMGGNKITNLANPTANTDAVPLGYANDNYAQAIKSADYPGCYYRTVNGLTEWINPPYVESTEYRTTERYMGQPVYTMLISESSWKSGNNIEVSFPNNKVYVTEISARVGSWALPFIDSTFTANGSAWVNVYTEVGKMVIQQRGGIGVSGALTIKVKYYYYA